MADGRIEQCVRLRAEPPPLSETAALVRGGPDTLDKLARQARRTARAWSLGGQPLLGISIFAVLDIQLGELLSARFATYRQDPPADGRTAAWAWLRTAVGRSAPALHSSPPPRRQRGA